MNIESIIDIIAKAAAEANKNKKRRNVSTGKSFQSSLFRNDIRTTDELLARLGRQWKHNLQNLLTLCQLLEYELAEYTHNEIALSCTSSLMTQHFGCIKSASNIIRLAERVDLLFCTSKEYCFNANKQFSKCRGYIVNKNMVSLIHNCCVRNNIVVNLNKNKKNSSSVYEPSSSQSLSVSYYRSSVPISCNLRNVRFSCHLRLPKTLTDNDIRTSLYQQYPLLAHYQQLAENLNKQYFKNCPKLLIGFTPTIHRSQSGLITKVGIRAASSVCGLPKAVDEASEAPTRSDFFKAYFGGRPIYEYDIKSSVYRVAYLITHNNWLPDSVDFYEEMAGGAFKNEEQRSNYKQLAMSLYFGGSSRKVAAQLLRRCPRLRDYDRNDILKAVSVAQERMFAAVGESLNTEVFLHESCICMDLLARLLEHGLRVVQVYDGFYSDNPQLPKLCREWLPDIATDYWFALQMESPLL